MLKVEVIEKDGKERIVVNSNIDEKSTLSNFGKPYDDIFLQNDEIIETLVGNTFEKVSEFVKSFHYCTEQIEDFEISIFINFLREEGVISPQISIYFSVSSLEWKKPYSITELSKVLLLIWDNEEYNLESNISEETIYWDFSLSYLIENPKLIMKDEIEKGINILKEIIPKTTQTLLAKLEKDPITSYFTFPEEIKTACKQYLVYFAQFLMDLGIEADTEIKEVAHQTLFKVIPKNKEESLDKIREALDVYLNIPKDFDIQVAQNNDVAVLQWQANIKHWESQVLIAKAAIQLKDATINSQIATIESLKLSNYQYREILEQKNLESEAKNEVEIAGGLVKVKEYDGDGFSINFPEILRRLKRIFK